MRFAASAVGAGGSLLVAANCFLLIKTFFMNPDDHLDLPGCLVVVARFLHANHVCHPDVAMHTLLWSALP